MIRAILKTLKIADDFADNWYLYTCNQAAHAAIVGGTLALILLWLGLPTLLVPPLAAGLYLLLWERMIQRGADWRDSLADAAHVGFGAALLALPFAGTPLPSTALLSVTLLHLTWLAVLAGGIRKRLACAKSKGTEND